MGRDQRDRHRRRDGHDAHAGRSATWPRTCLPAQDLRREGRSPPFFVKTPYNMNLWGNGDMNTGRLRRPLEAVRRGYAYVNQNERGKLLLGGRVGHPRSAHHRRVRRPDLDLRAALVERHWWGRIGCSSTAEWQMGLASLDHPAHAAMVPQGFGAGVGRVGRLVRAGQLVPRRRRADAVLQLALRRAEHPASAASIGTSTAGGPGAAGSRYFDLAPEMPRAWTGRRRSGTCRVEDIMRHVGGPKGVFADAGSRSRPAGA